MLDHFIDTAPHTKQALSIKKQIQNMVTHYTLCLMNFTVSKTKQIVRHI